VCIGIGVECVERIAGRLMIGCGGEQAGLGRGIRFEFQAQGENFLRLLRRHRPHEKAAIRLGEHQPVLLEPRQCFAERNLADLEFGRERVLADGEVRLDCAGKDVVTQYVGQGVRRIAVFDRRLRAHAREAT
jgi:hypothetical protein